MKEDEEKRLVQEASQSETEESSNSGELNFPVVLSDRYISKKLLITTLPLATMGFLTASQDFLIRATMIARMGEKTLAADGMLSLTRSFLIDSTAAVLIPVSIMVGQSFGNGDLQNAGQIVQQGWILAGILWIPATAGLLLTEPMLNLLGQTQEITSIVGPYARAISIATPAIFGLMVDYNFLKATSKACNLLPFYIFEVAVGTGFSYVLAFGKFGFPTLGTAGIGYAMSLQFWLTWAALKIYFMSAQEFEPYKLFELRPDNIRHIKRILKLGIPLYGLSLSEQTLNFLSGIMIGRLGVNQLAINQAISLYIQLLKPITGGIRQTCKIFVSQFKGNRDYRNMKRFGDLGIGFEFGVNLLPLIAFSSFSTQLVSVFIPEESIEDTVAFIRLSFITKAIAKLLEAIQGAATENLEGLSQTFFPSVVQVLTNLAVILPLSYVMGFVFDWDLVGVNAGAAIGINISTFITLWRWNTLSRNIRLPTLEVEETARLDPADDMLFSAQEQLPQPIDLDDLKETMSDSNIAESSDLRITPAETNSPSQPVAAPTMLTMYNSLKSKPEASSASNSIEDDAFKPASGYLTFSSSEI